MIERASFIYSVKCNLKCRMCRLWKIKSNQTMSQDLIFHTIDELKKIDIKEVVLSGGELLLNPPLLYAAVKKLTDYNIKVFLITNGIYLSSDITENLANLGIKQIMVSVDGPKGVHNFLRGKGVFEKVITNLRALIKLKKTKRINIEIATTTVICNRNLNYLEDFTRFLEALGVELVEFQPLNLALGAFNINSFKTQKTIFREIGIKKRDLSGLKLCLKKLRSIKSQRPNLVGNSLDYFEIMEEYFAKSKLPFVCYVNKNSLGINWKGEVFFCFHKKPIGRLTLKKSLLEIINPKTTIARVKEIRNCEEKCIGFNHQPHFENYE